MKNKPKKPMILLTLKVSEEMFEALDKLAQKLDRSRSWIVREGIKKVLGKK